MGGPQQIQYQQLNEHNQRTFVGQALSFAARAAEVNGDPQGAQALSALRADVVGNRISKSDLAKELTELEGRFAKGGAIHRTLGNALRAVGGPVEGIKPDAGLGLSQGPEPTPPGHGRAEPQGGVEPGPSMGVSNPRLPPVRESRPANNPLSKLTGELDHIWEQGIGQKKAPPSPLSQLAVLVGAIDTVVNNRDTAPATRALGGDVAQKMDDITNTMRRLLGNKATGSGLAGVAATEVESANLDRATSLGTTGLGAHWDLKHIQAIELQRQADGALLTQLTQQRDLLMKEFLNAGNGPIRRQQTLEALVSLDAQIQGGLQIMAVREEYRQQMLERVGAPNAAAMQRYQALLDQRTSRLGPVNQERVKLIGELTELKKTLEGKAQAIPDSKELKELLHGKTQDERGPARLGLGDLIQRLEQFGPLR